MPVKKLNTSGGTLGYLYWDHIWLMKSWNKAVWTQVILNCFWMRSASLVWKEQGRGKEQVSLQKVLPMPAQPTTICVSKVHISRHFLTNVSLHIFILYMNLCIPRGGLEDCRAHPHLKFITSDKFFLGLISPSCSVQMVHSLALAQQQCRLCPCSGDFPSYPRNHRDKDMITWAHCEKGYIGENLQVIYKVMASPPIFQHIAAKYSHFVSIILIMNNLLLFYVIVFS